MWRRQEQMAERMDQMTRSLFGQPPDPFFEDPFFTPRLGGWSSVIDDFRRQTEEPRHFDIGQ